MRDALGIPGALAILLVLAWVVGWLVLGVHGRWIHFLIPLAIVLFAAQMTRRVSG